MKTKTKALPRIVSQKQWQAAHERLLVKEKAATRARDALAATRRRQPMVEIEGEYVFPGPDGKASLLDLFKGRRQLIVYHFMFAPGVDGWPKAHTDDVVMFDVPPPVVVRGISAYRRTWPPFFRWQREENGTFDIVKLNITAGDTVAFATALLRCGSKAELAKDDRPRLRLTIGLRKVDGTWKIAQINVPLNNKLQRLDPDSMDEPARRRAREDFEPRWNRWNAVRAACASLTAIVLMVLLVRSRS